LVSNSSSESEAKCALCGRTFGEQQEGEKRYIIEEVIDGTSYKFDARDCINMFKRFKSVYGDDFKQFIGQQGQQEQQQFISDPFWNKAIPTEQEIREIDKDTRIEKQDIIQVIRDPTEILRIGLEIGKTAKDEILILFSTANAFHRIEKLGAFRSLREVVEEQGVKTRILTPKSELTEGSIDNLRQQEPRIDVRHIEPGLQTQVTIVVVDRKSSLIVELKDDTKNTSYEAMGLGIHTNRKASVLSYVSIFESLWKQTELYQQVNSLYDQLKVHDKMQEEFINIAAHELRTPIQPILGLAEILRSKKENITNTNVYDEYLSVIIRNARRLKELTDNILDITRIESKTMTLNMEVIDIDSVIQEASQDIIKNQVDPDRAVELLFDSSGKHGDDHSEIIPVRADSGRIRQVISNLISNAFNFTKTGTISITKEKRRKGKLSSVIVSVKDTGPGIDPRILPRLFTKFATRSDKGTGLGLYICKRIVEAHGGRIWGRNNDGQGATFSFSLPINRED
jgi:nitrogen-specific signal transduction histidine kinase